MVQEYIPEDEGEYTIGVLSFPDTEVLGSIVMKRIFNSKLSVAYRGKSGLISSGYSQGLIYRNREIEKQAIEIAKAIGSKGPINIQGRIRNGKIVPFEINPRFSASTYLRAMAGFNEIDFFLQFLQDGIREFDFKINEGYYLRSFEETYVPLSLIEE